MSRNATELLYLSMASLQSQIFTTTTTTTSTDDAQEDEPATNSDIVESASNVATPIATSQSEPQLERAGKTAGASREDGAYNVQLTGEGAANVTANEDVKRGTCGATANSPEENGNIYEDYEPTPGSGVDVSKAKSTVGTIDSPPEENENIYEDCEPDKDSGGAAVGKLKVPNIFMH